MTFKIETSEGRRIRRVRPYKTQRLTWNLSRKEHMKLPITLALSLLPFRLPLLS